MIIAKEWWLYTSSQSWYEIIHYILVLTFASASAIWCNFLQERHDCTFFKGVCGKVANCAWMKILRTGFAFCSSGDAPVRDACKQQIPCLLLLLSVHSHLVCCDLPVHTDGSESEDWHVHRHRLDEVDQVAHEAPEHPAAGVEGVRQREGHARGTHQHVGEGQVPDEEVGDVVHLAGAADDVEEQVVAEHAHQGHQGVAGDDERFEGLQQLHAHKLGAALGGAVVQRHLKDLTAVTPVHIMKHRAWGGELSCPAAACALHPRSLLSTWRCEIMIIIHCMWCFVGNFVQQTSHSTWTFTVSLPKQPWNKFETFTVSEHTKDILNKKHVLQKIGPMRNIFLKSRNDGELVHVFASVPSFCFQLKYLLPLLEVVEARDVLIWWKAWACHANCSHTINLIEMFHLIIFTTMCDCR